VREVLSHNANRRIVEIQRVVGVVHRDGPVNIEKAFQCLLLFDTL
jgi:hypothetical protein